IEKHIVKINAAIIAVRVVVKMNVALFAVRVAVRMNVALIAVRIVVSITARILVRIVWIKSLDEMFKVRYTHI
ncbi:hypothetical protein J4G37_57595, partial [Microvirga sp. 3-52]|nr:hypothetical protein [Microvirga sp. 3-52]